MSVAQWAPWAAVFLGGCLSGAALLSLSSDPPVDTRRAVTVPPESAPAEPAEPAEPTEAHEDEAHEADSATLHDVAPSDTALAEPAESEAGPSAADILAALEQAYQRQVTEAEASEAPDPEAVPEVEPPPAPAEAAPVPPAAAQHDAPVMAAAEAVPHESPREVEVDEGANAPHEVAVAAHAEPDQAPIQQIAVLYQPVYVLPPGTNPAGQTTTPAPRAIGRDPWAPLTISPRHNPWGSAGITSGVWAAGNVAGGVWAAGFTAGP